MFHGRRWWCDQRFFAPMATLMDGQSIFVRDCITFNHPMGDIVKGVVVKFFQKDNSVDLLEEIDVLANLQQFQYLVPDTTATHLSSDTLILCETIVLPVFSILGTVECPEDIIKWTPPGMFSRIDVEEITKYFAPHHLEAKAMGRPVVMLPLVLFADDTSGNRSKKWHKLESWFLRLAGLPTRELGKPIVEELAMLENEGIEVYDAFRQQNVLVVAPLMCIIADNPMASQLLNHLTGGVLKYCRFCMVGRNLDPCAICSRRTQQQTLQQIMEIRRQPTEVAKARLRTLYGLNEDDNDLLDALCDLFQSTPLEVLHTILLGPCKYLLKEFMPQLSARQKAEILSRLRAFCSSGLKVKLYDGDLCHGSLNEGQLKVLLSFTKVFHIAYCEYFSLSIRDEWQELCQEFVSNVKLYMPAMHITTQC
ncbi:hypothetical protein EMCRGX_G023059 [Ephydatia muelleri]